MTALVVVIGLGVAALANTVRAPGAQAAGARPRGPGDVQPEAGGAVSRFAPVFLPEGRELNGRVSVTFGRAENVCSRAGFLYAKHKGAGRTHPLERGSALHRILQLGTLAAVDAGEPMVPPELVKAIANEVLADPAYRCPIEEHDYIRESAYRWADHATFETRTLVACETLFVLDVGAFQMRGKIDRADLVEDGQLVKVEDYKSSRTMPSYEEVGRTLRDGRIAAKAYQLVLYALLIAFGRPVREERCSTCNVDSDGTPIYPDGEGAPDCPTCRGRGVEEIVEPFGVADQAQRFELDYVFPGIDAGGEMGRRGTTLTRLELIEYMASLEAQMARVGAAEKSGDWPATSGTHCSECPAMAECPIPDELRSFEGRVNTVDEAVEAAERLWRERQRHQARWDELKLFVKTQVPGQRLRFGTDQVITPTVVTKRVIRDKDGMRDAIERARTTGEPFDLGEWEKVQTSTPITQRRLTEEELEAEATGAITSEGSNGG